ncbi:MAG: CBS domain-containing protein [Bacteroidia bacterium]|nr:CBS domain-containing protein [Bacteroidia bacterium]
MLAKYLISDLVPALKTSDTGIKALNWMEVFRVSHLPIVNNEEFLGLISDTDIYDLNMANEPIGNHKLSLIRPFVTHEQHVFQVLDAVARLKLSVIPVLDNNNKYLGLITLHDLVQYFAKMMAIEQPGAIIVLELNQNDYSLSEIAQIIEGNDAKILNLSIMPQADSTKLDIIIKINRIDITPVLQTFNRYNYTVKASFMKDDVLESLYTDRFESFMTYLNV